MKNLEWCFDNCERRNMNFKEVFNAMTLTQTW